MRRGAVIACAAAALLGFAWGPVLGLPADAAPRTAPSWARGLPACVYEDGSGGPLPCYWDAGNMGNGRGRSYVIRADGTTDYQDPYCQYDVYGHEISVMGIGGWPGVKVSARVNSRTLRGKLGRDGTYTWQTKGVYTQEDVHAYVNGHRCEGT